MLDDRDLADRAGDGPAQFDGKCRFIRHVRDELQSFGFRPTEVIGGRDLKRELSSGRDGDAVVQRRAIQNEVRKRGGVANVNRQRAGILNRKGSRGRAASAHRAKFNDLSRIVAIDFSGWSDDRDLSISPTSDDRGVVVEPVLKRQVHMRIAIGVEQPRQQSGPLAEIEVLASHANVRDAIAVPVTHNRRVASESEIDRRADSLKKPLQQSRCASDREQYSRDHSNLVHAIAIPVTNDGSISVESIDQWLRPELWSESRDRRNARCRESAFKSFPLVDSVGS